MAKPHVMVPSSTFQLLQWKGWVSVLALCLPMLDRSLREHTGLLGLLKSGTESPEGGKVRLLCIPLALFKTCIMAASWVSSVFW